MTSDITRRISLTALAVTAVIFCVSCGKFGPEKSGSKVIKTRVVSGGLVKSSTRGVTNTTELVNTEGKRFTIHGFLERSKSDEQHHYINGVNVAFDGAAWEWVLSEVEEAPEWVSDETIRFWSLYPADVWADASLITAFDYSLYGRQLAFSYAHPSPTLEHNDAVNQKDILVAYNLESRSFDRNGNYRNGKNQYMNIRFYHALAKICFDVSGVLGTNRVSNITLKNVAGQSDFTAEWSESESSLKINGSADPLSYTDYSQDYVPEDFNVDGSQKESGEKFFFMIPEDLWYPGASGAQNPEISVRFSNGDVKTRAFCSSQADKYSWEPGKYYKYKLNYNGDNFELILSSVIDIDDWDLIPDIDLDL